MPNMGALLKDEIVRLCRKELKQHVDPLRKASATHRREIAALKRQIALLERQNNVLSKRVATWDVGARERGPEASERPLRFVAKGLKSLRARLGLSAENCGRLLGVSGQSVYNWESGKTVPRREQLVTLASLRGMSKSEAVRRLESSEA